MSKPVNKPAVIYGHHNTHQATLKSYVTGFSASMVLTVWAYLLATRHRFSGWTVIGSLLALAVVQFFVQIFYFLHIGHESKPRWKQMLLFMMIGVVLIVVLGSIWIMYNLNYHMTQQQIHSYLQKQDGGI